MEWEVHKQPGLCNMESRETACTSQWEWRHLHQKNSSAILMTPSSMLKWPLEMLQVPLFKYLYYFCFSMHFTKPTWNTDYN